MEGNYLTEYLVFNLGWNHQLENLLMLVWMCVFGRAVFSILHMSSGVIVLAFVKGCLKASTCGLV